MKSGNEQFYNSANRQQNTATEVSSFVTAEIENFTVQALSMIDRLRQI